MTEQHLNRSRVAGPYIIAACITCINYGILIAISGYMGWVTGTWVAILRVIPGHSWTWSVCFLLIGSVGMCVVGNPRWPRAETFVCFIASLWLFIVGCFFVYSVFHSGTPSNAALAWFMSFVFGYYAAGTISPKKNAAAKPNMNVTANVNVTADITVAPQEEIHASPS